MNGDTKKTYPMKNAHCNDSNEMKGDAGKAWKTGKPPYVVRGGQIGDLMIWRLQWRTSTVCASHSKLCNTVTWWLDNRPKWQKCYDSWVCSTTAPNDATYWKTWSLIKSTEMTKNYLTLWETSAKPKMNCTTQEWARVRDEDKLVNCTRVRWCL